MNLQEFNKQYSKVVKEYISKRAKNIVYWTISGKTWSIYNSFSELFCMTLSKKYIIPPKIAEILEIPKIHKLNANAIHIELDYELDWHKEPLSSVWGVDHIHFDDFTCHSCNWQGSVNSMWVIRSNITNTECLLCDSCYEAKRFHCLYNCNAGHLKYIRYCINEFNITDWVKFMQDSRAKFYVNCNPGSSMYGIVCMLSEFSRSFSKIGTCDQLIDYICEWIQIPAPKYPLKDAIQYLQSEYWSMQEHEEKILIKAGINCKNITMGEIFQNAYKIKDPNDYKSLMDPFYEELIEELLGNSTKLNMFSYWLQVKLNIYDF